ncbi:MAG TPA: alpha-L-arabinofuranosidase C-terminal domain-containing protein [Bryobacteraceae bacterium]|nr:alpha-L-arabinofuranosidase C-terminal domain-containing protein [Bryobacteraceae bacterium]
MRPKLALLCLGLWCAGVRAQPDTVIAVDASRTGHAIPRTIYGTFLEPIGHSTYGGLWAQILENPSFEDSLWSAGRLSRMISQRKELADASNIGLPLPWEPLHPAQGWRYEPRWGDAANSERSLLIMALPGQETGVRQLVYLPVHRTLRYTGSLYAKPVSGPRELEVSLRRRDRPDEVFARQKLRLPAAGWTRYEFSLELAKGAVAGLEAVDFAIAISDEARVLVDQAFLFPADAIDGMNPEMIAYARDMKTPLVRYGGNYTSGYHWRDGVGPMDRRVTMLNQSWGMPEYNHFGTDEFLRFCELIGAQPQIALNLGSGTPEEAADWVRYVNGKWGDRAGGLVWELGNELWGNFQIGYPTLARIAERTKEFSDAVRRADPRSRLIATGQDPDHFEQWNAAQLKLGPDALNYLSTHFVVRTADVQKANPSPEFIAQAALALPVGLERQLRSMKQQIDADAAARGRVRIAFTEWLFTGPAASAPTYDNLGGALCTAGFLNTLLRTADFTPVSDMTGLIEFGGVWQKRARVYGVPAYWAFRMYSRADAATLVETKVQGEQYDVDEGVKRIPAIRSVPYLDVVSALNAGGTRLTLFCVNRHLTRQIPAAVQLSGFTAVSSRAQQLTSKSLYDGNSEEHPEAIVPVDVRVNAQGRAFEFTFPPMSVTVIELEGRH